MAEKELKIKFEDLPSSIKESIDLEKGKIQDFISGEWVVAIPEEVEAVQVFVRRLVEDYGYEKSQIQTHPQFRVRKRPSDEKREYPVDIAVFKSSKRIESNLFMIVECKQPDEVRGKRQLKIYMDLSPAIVGVWFNGGSHAYIRKSQKTDGTLEYINIPNIPQKGQRLEDIGLFKRKDLKPTQNLKILFKDIRNHLSQQAVGIARDEILAQQVMNLLFCKIYDEINTGPKELVTFRSGIGETSTDVALRIKELFNQVINEYNDIFNETDSIDLDDDSINYVVGELQNYCITEAERDVLGDAFEVFIGPALKGAQGQFFTPRNVVKMAIEITNPQPGDFIIDPACGSGGFLIVALEQVWKQIEKEGKDRKLGNQWIKNKQKSIANKHFRGIDKDSFLAKVTKAYMAIVGDGRGGIFCENSLEAFDKWNAKTRDKIKHNFFDVLFTNPPFGAKIPIEEKEILENFNLGCKWRKKEYGRKWEKTNSLHKKQPPQVLFIERCLDLLKPGGKMAIVLPDGVLGGSRIGYVANYIRNKAKIIALVDCSTVTFQPFVPTKTHLVFLQKMTEKESKKNEEYDVFMAIADKVGHDKKGKPIYIVEDGEKKVDDDMPRIINQYKKYKENGLKKEEFNDFGYLVSSKWLENYLLARRYLPKFTKVIEKLENSGMDLKRLREIKYALYTGANIDATEYMEHSDYRYIMTDCVQDFGVNPSKFKYISQESYKSNKSKILKENDIIINRTGNPGVSIFVSKDIEGVMGCGFVFILKIKEKYNPNYISAFLNSKWGRLQMERVSFGSLLEHITKDDLENIIIAFPKDEKFMEDIASKSKGISDIQMESRNLFLKLKKSLENNNFLKK